MRKLIVSEFITLDGVIQAPGGEDEDRDGGFTHGGWTMPFWHDDIGKRFGALMKDVDAILLGRRTYVTHAEAFEPMPPGDPFGDMMNTPHHYVVSTTLTNLRRCSVVRWIDALLRDGPPLLWITSTILRVLGCTITISSRTTT